MTAPAGGQAYKAAHVEAAGGAAPPGSMRAGLLLLLAALLGPARLAAPRSGRYAVDCPQGCDPARCPRSPRCRAVLDDCGCCRVCAAERGQTCYRTVSGVDGVKCGPGLRCHFYSEEDDFGDEFGVCKGKEGPFASPGPGGAGAAASPGGEGGRRWVRDRARQGTPHLTPERNPAPHCFSLGVLRSCSGGPSCLPFRAASET